MNVRTQQTLGGHTGKLHTAIVATSIVATQPLSLLASFLDGHSFLSFKKHLFFACCSWWISAYLGCHVFHLTHVVVIVLENSGLDQLTFPSSLWTAWGESCIHFSHAFLQNLLPEGCPQTTRKLSRTGQSKRPSGRMGSRILLWLAFTYRTTYRCKRMYDCCA